MSLHSPLTPKTRAYDPPALRFLLARGAGWAGTEGEQELLGSSDSWKQPSPKLDREEGGAMPWLPPVSAEIVRQVSYCLPRFPTGPELPLW